ncbi:unnamed protein product [Adineta ricciae]|uniref:HMG box domain-containing protein n=1 Tax=Adineta ricciae TaxID=249248 RepID=A0A814FZ44_ADIRI|nr:unnamed protein product [Adineta ricciae]CAF1560227.1 unnamed protein product [Adineta ricciae]
MPTNIILPSANDLTLDLSIKSSSKGAMTTTEKSSSILTTSDLIDSGGGNNSNDTDEVKIFECEKHEDVETNDDDNSDRLSPVIKEDDSSPHQSSSINLTDRLNSEQQLHSFFPYFISPYYHGNNPMQNFEKMPSLESLSKFMSPPPPAHMATSNLNVEQSIGMPNPMYALSSSTSFQSPYSQTWRSPVFPFALPPGYPLSQNSSSPSMSSSHKRPTHMRRFIDNNSQQSSQHKQSMHQDSHKSKKSHIKKPLNAFMLFMKEQRAHVVQECTLRESAAINQILGRKWHELDRNVQQKYYDMARDERMKHMQLYPGWSARDNYGVRKKRGNKGKKQEKAASGENAECLNQKKCRARFGLDQQANWCKHCKRKKKCLRYTENESTSSMGVTSWSDEDDTDNNDDSDDCDVIPMNEQKNSGIHPTISMDSDEENKSRLLKYQQTSNENDSIMNRSDLMTTRKELSYPASFFQPTYPYPYFDSFLPPPPTTSSLMTNLNEFKQET